MIMNELNWQHEGPHTRYVCKACGARKKAEDFPVDARTKRGRRGQCRDCRSSYRVARYHVTDEKRRRRSSSSYRETQRAGADNRRLNPASRLKIVVTTSRSRARKIKAVFDLDDHMDELLKRFSSGRCEVTGLPFDMEAKRAWNSPSLDRIKPERGYIFDNVRFVLWSFNAAIGDWGEDVLAEVASAFLERRNVTA